jgi:hypothetical protein
VPHYRYEPMLGDPRAAYQRAGSVHPGIPGPEVAGVFVADVDGETTINTMWGSRQVAWQAPAGTPTVILGYWADDTVHLRWPAISGSYRVDGRFPRWVVRADLDTPLAGGGHWLSANDPPVRPRRPSRVLTVALIVLVVLLVLLLLPPTRDVLVGWLVAR